MPAVRFEHVSKKFTLHHERPRSFQELFLNLVHLERPSRKELYWALKDVSFEVPTGEMVGIIGPNGAGKSTILKLISRIIEPTSGQAEIDGRVGALLELGAGFHPDLTGRENVYLNGSILGFSRSEMARIFEDIVGFSEMERFIDVPVKHYSSGMYMRLGFSVAINLRPDILLVDEVLSVGDQAFQLRCLDRINEMKRQGVTIILVTHSLKQVSQMCTRAVWLEDGQIKADGPVEHVLDEYWTQIHASDEQALQRSELRRREELVPGDLDAGRAKGKTAERDESAWRWGSREAEIVQVQLLDSQGQEQRNFHTGETFVARMHYVAHQRIQNPVFGVALHNANGFHITGPNTGSAPNDVQALEGNGHIDYVIPTLPLLKGTYLFSAAIYDKQGEHAYDHHHQAYTFRVTGSTQTQGQHGSLFIPSQWQLGDSLSLEQDDIPGEAVSR